jgi:ABC-type uncharacterized transport system involved in gliding motility auxiliary subunit
MRHLDRTLAGACLVAAVLLLAVALGLVLVDRQLSNSASYYLIAGVALLICYGLLAPRAVIDAARSRRARFGSLSVVVSALVIGILVTGNVIASRALVSADFTRGQLYSLSPKSTAVLQRLDSDLQVTGFFRPNSDPDDLRADTALLAEYQKASPHVQVRFVDPDTHADLARRLGVKINGGLAFQYRTKPPIVLNLGSQTEADITGSILKLQSSRTPLICWAAGEGERDLKEVQLFGYSDTASQLANDNFKTRETVLAQASGIPADCDVLAIVGLQRPLAAATIKAIQAYVDGGGRLVLAVDPWLDRPVLDSANLLLEPYQAKFDGGLVLDTDPAHTASNDNTTPLVFQYGASPITADLANRYTFFPQPTSISGQGATGVLVTKIAETSEASYQIADVRDNAQFERRPGDPGGPFTLMATMEKDAGGKTARVVLVGTSAFAENRTLPPNAPGFNLQLMLGSFDWLAGNDELIKLPAKPQTATPLLLSTFDLFVISLITVVLVPLLVAGVGAVVWLRRRGSFATA